MPDPVKCHGAPVSSSLMACEPAKKKEEAREVTVVGEKQPKCENSRFSQDVYFSDTGLIGSKSKWIASPMTCNTAMPAIARKEPEKAEADPKQKTKNELLENRGFDFSKSGMNSIK